MNIFEVKRLEQYLENMVSRFPQAIALTEWTGSVWKTISYQTLFSKADAFAQQMQACGIKPGERIILSSRNRIESIAALLGVWMTRATAVLVDPDLPDAIWQRQCHYADTRIIMVETTRLYSAKKTSAYQWIVEFSQDNTHWHENKPVLSSTLFADCDETIATLVFTSGTSGSYQPVILKHEHFLYLLQSYRDAFSHSVCGITVYPLFHVAGLFCGILQGMALGMQIVFFRAFSAHALQEAFMIYHPDILLAVPRLLDVLYQKIQFTLLKKNIFLRGLFNISLKLSFFLDKYCHCRVGKILFCTIHQQLGGRLKTILCGSAALSPKIQHFFLSLGFDVLCSYGLTETGGPITLCAKKQRWKIGSVGHCIEKKDLRISTSGEILYRGKALMSGYFRNHALTETVIKQGWLYTGDLGKQDHLGNLFVFGRMKELIVFPDGKKAMPEQIEFQYSFIPGMEMFAVFGVQNEAKMTAILAFVPEKNTDVQHTINHIFKQSSQLQSPYRIADVLVVDHIPQSSTLKTKRYVLVNNYLSQQNIKITHTTALSNDVALKRLLTCFQTVLSDKKKGVSVDSTFAQLNIDSLQAAQLSSMLSEQLKMQINPTVFWLTHSVRELYHYLLQDCKNTPVLSSQKIKPVFEKIAVIAMDAIFPKSKNTNDFWENCLSGVDAIIEIPSNRFDINHFYDPYFLAPGKTNSRFGGFIDLADDFSGDAFGLKPREIAWMDPQQKILLMQTARLLQPWMHKYFMSHHQTDKVGFYLGAGFPDYMIHSIQKRSLDSINAAAGIGMSDFSIVGRVAYHFGLQGPCMMIKTACSSSLVAVHQAVRALQCGDCDMAIAGGVNLVLIPEMNVCLTKAGFLSPDGRCKTFDASANGYVRSEGCGLILLKRYRDAIADGDCILATIIGSAVNQDGKTNGLTSPNGKAQMDCYQTALQRADLSPSRVSYIEAHGSGTKLGDAIEMQSIQAVYDHNRDDPLYVGAVKTNIGHAESAAGIAGLIKTILILQHQIIPPNLHYDTLNPAISFKNSAVRLPLMKTPFQKTAQYAAVSSFGVTGTNAHVIVEKGLS